MYDDEEYDDYCDVNDAYTSDDDEEDINYDKA